MKPPYLCRQAFLLHRLLLRHGNSMLPVEAGSSHAVQTPKLVFWPRKHFTGPYNVIQKTSQAINFFPVKIAATWNQLPENIVSAGTVNTFKNRFGKYWNMNPPCIARY
ncbi:hypothetical protein FHG87_020647 [Trinorchestia longiramus]|nr:hypothetical protein FHG87_020647 [Trinorchestia longiramus]